eukprot:TRINITY_DN7472_c0_g1_i1.p1 TRINITY_DN7472_c0_g1~~TRINITY_DN7472_c0_g1_i1.p1  ORF type:complete len:468 (+),score=79.37 TRINITY_DN7472_c0_g1_i1:184-1587(+)
MAMTVMTRKAASASQLGSEKPAGGGYATRKCPEFTLLMVPTGESKEYLGESRGYQHIRNIGRGSFGTASLVRDKAGSECVIKAVDISNLNQRQREVAVEEASVLASLKHPYIVRYRDGFIEGGSLAIVTDFAQGGDLYARVVEVRQSGKAFTETQILRWMAQATLGLKCLHERQIIHRDIKSQNLFLGSHGQLQIGDFGICKVLKGGSAGSFCEKQTIGTPLYFSPEIVSKNMYSFASDIWALGCVLHELAVLRLPFEASNLPALVTKIALCVLEELPERFSKELRQLCLDLLSKDPATRPTCSEVAKNALIRGEMARMLQEEQQNVSECSMPTSGRQISTSRPPLSLNHTRFGAAGGRDRVGPCTPSGTLKRVGSAALLQAPQTSADLKQWRPHSRQSSVSRPSSRSTSASGDSFSRPSSCAGSREASQSRPSTPSRIASPLLEQPSRSNSKGFVFDRTRLGRIQS